MVDSDLIFILELPQRYLRTLATALQYDPFLPDREQPLSALPEAVQADELAQRREELIQEIAAVGSGAAGRLALQSPTYASIVGAVARALRLKPQDYTTIVEVEKAIAIEAFRRVNERLSPEHREALKAQIDKHVAADRTLPHSPTVLPEVVGLAALTAAQLSGFGVYILATSAVSAVAGAAGLTLPFAAYAGLSTALSVAIGPVGWVVLGAGLLYKLGKPSLRKQMILVLVVAGLRGLHTESTSSDRRG